MKVHMRNVPASDDVDASIIARGTPGFCGADLENVVNEAALFAARSGKRLVEMEDFEKAKDKIMMGAERKSMVMSEKERRNTAYHESGHAIVGRTVPEYDQLYKITIVPRGRALGVTMFLPEEDRYSMSRRSILSQICTLFGGRVAEEMINGTDGITTGAANDIERASQLGAQHGHQVGLLRAHGAAPVRRRRWRGVPRHVRRRAVEADLQPHGAGRSTRRCARLSMSATTRRSPFSPSIATSSRTWPRR